MILLLWILTAFFSPIGLVATVHGVLHHHDDGHIYDNSDRHLRREDSNGRFLINRNVIKEGAVADQAETLGSNQHKKEVRKIPLLHHFCALS